MLPWSNPFLHCGSPPITRRFLQDILRSEAPIGRWFPPSRRKCSQSGLTAARVRVGRGMKCLLVYKFKRLMSSGEYSSGFRCFTVSRSCCTAHAIAMQRQIIHDSVCFWMFADHRSSTCSLPSTMTSPYSFRLKSRSTMLSQARCISSCAFLFFHVQPGCSSR